MPGHHFLSYSRFDAEAFALRLHDALEAGAPPLSVWLDKIDLKPGQDWDEQIADKFVPACRCAKAASTFQKRLKPTDPRGRFAKMLASSIACCACSTRWRWPMRKAFWRR
jgi:hypothetical protein